jgi:hypothetical protein
MKSSQHFDISMKLTSTRLRFFTEASHKPLPSKVRDLVYEAILDDGTLEQLDDTHRKRCINSPANITDYFSLDIFDTGVTPTDVALPMLKVNIDALPITRLIGLHNSFAPLFDEGQRWGRTPGRGGFCLEIDLNVHHSLDEIFEMQYPLETCNVSQAPKGVIRDVEARGVAVEIYSRRWDLKISLNMRERMEDKGDWDNGTQRV